MTRYITSTIFLIIFLLTTNYAQEHPLPLKITSILSNYKEDIFSDTYFDVNSDNENIQKFLGHRYEVIIDFDVENSSFLFNPNFRIFMSNWNNEIWCTDIYSGNIVSQDNNNLSVRFTTDVLEAVKNHFLTAR